MGKQSKTIGLIGCGRWGRYILKDLKAMGCKVVVLARQQPSQDNARQEHADMIVADYAALFDQACDGFIVATPTETHLEVIRALMVAGKPIFTEKPISNDLIECKKLLDTANVPIFVMDKWKYHNGIIKLAELVKDKKYGKIKQLILKRTQWRSPHLDVDPVWILLPHDISIAQYLLGETPKALFAIGNVVNQDNLNSLYALLEVNDCKVIIEVSGDAVNVERSVSVVCEQASFYLANAYTDNIQMQQNKINVFGDTPQQIPFETNMPLNAEIQRFVDYLEDNELVVNSSLEEGYETVKLISQLRKMAAG